MFENIGTVRVPSVMKLKARRIFGYTKVSEIEDRCLHDCLASENISGDEYIYTAVYHGIRWTVDTKNCVLLDVDVVHPGQDTVEYRDEGSAVGP